MGNSFSHACWRWLRENLTWYPDIEILWALKIVIPPPNEVGCGVSGILDSPCPSVPPSVDAWFPGRNSSLFWNINFKFHMHVLCVYGQKPSLFPVMSLSKWPPGSHIRFYGFRTLTLVWLWILSPNFTDTLLVCMGRSLLIFSNGTFKMAAWRSYWIFRYLDLIGGIVSGA